MNQQELEELAEDVEHARWIVEQHVRAPSDGPGRGRCSRCEQWWPCDLVMLAALAVLRTEERDALLVERPNTDQ
jgi:hypothetical protein